MPTQTPKNLYCMYQSLSNAGLCYISSPRFSPLSSLLGRSHIRFSPSLNSGVQFYRPLSLPNKPNSHAVSSHLPFHPLVSTGLENAESASEMQTTPKQSSKTVQVRFVMRKECKFGEQLFLVGEDPILGSWDPCNAIALKWSDGHIWTVEMDIPVELSIEFKFKFILKASTGYVHWQPGGDRILQACVANKGVMVMEEDWEFEKEYDEEWKVGHITEEFMSGGSNELRPIVSNKNPKRLSSKTKASVKDEEGTLFDYEQGPVLVPGLTPLSSNLLINHTS